MKRYRITVEVTLRGTVEVEGESPDAVRMDFENDVAGLAQSLSYPATWELTDWEAESVACSDCLKKPERCECEGER